MLLGGGDEYDRMVSARLGNWVSAGPGAGVWYGVLRTWGAYVTIGYRLVPHGS